MSQARETDLLDLFGALISWSKHASRRLSAAVAEADRYYDAREEAERAPMAQSARLPEPAHTEPEVLPDPDELDVVVNGFQFPPPPKRTS